MVYSEKPRSVAIAPGEEGRKQQNRQNDDLTSKTISKKWMRWVAAIGPCGSRKVKCVDWDEPPSRGSAKSAQHENGNTLQSDRDRSSGAACVAFIPAPSRLISRPVRF